MNMQAQNYFFILFLVYIRRFNVYDIFTLASYTINKNEIAGVYLA